MMSELAVQLIITVDQKHLTLKRQCAKSVSRSVNWLKMQNISAFANEINIQSETWS